MRKQPKSTIFKFILNNQQTLDNLNQIKINDYHRFIRLCNIGKQIQSLSNHNQYEALDHLIELNILSVPLLKLEIEDAFISSFNLKNYDITQYFLENGIQTSTIEDSIISLSYSLEYLANDPPIEMLKLLLQYGGNARYAEAKQSQTALHVASKYGCLSFVELLVIYNADVNGVDDSKKTPLNYAIERNAKDVIDFLRSKKASEHWNK